MLTTRSIPSAALEGGLRRAVGLGGDSGAGGDSLGRRLWLLTDDSGQEGGLSSLFTSPVLARDCHPNGSTNISFPD